MSEQKLKIRIVIKPPDDVPAAPTPPEPDHKSRRMVVAIFLGLAAITVIAVLGWQYLTPRTSGDSMANKAESPTVAKAEAPQPVGNDAEGTVSKADPDPGVSPTGTSLLNPSATETASVEPHATGHVTTSSEPASREMPAETLPEREQEPVTETAATELDTEQFPGSVAPIADTAAGPQAAAVTTTGTEPAAAPESEETVDPDTAKVSSQPESGIGTNERQAQAAKPAGSAAAGSTIPSPTPPPSTPGSDTTLPIRPDVVVAETDAPFAQIAQSETPDTPMAPVNETRFSEVKVDENASDPATAGSAADNLPATLESIAPGLSSEAVSTPATTVTAASQVVEAPAQSIPPTAPGPEAVSAPVAQAGADALSDRVARSALSNNVLDREPVDELSGTVMLESGSARRLYYFTELQDMAGETVQHRWIRNGETMATVTFPIRGVRWRIYSSKLLSSGMDGEWEARAESANGEVLDRIVFNAVRP